MQLQQTDATFEVTIAAKGAVFLRGERRIRGGQSLPGSAAIRCGSINMLGSTVYFVPSGKNRLSSQGKR